ncbi:uncharacterized protein [Montipora capricornis]|uniref:uncharacterized protein n=1 Tax=Montipora capricornis TaxID=246305 RepID=UPI0035F217DB
MTGPSGNSESCFPSSLNVPLGFASGNIEVSGEQNSLFPLGPVIKCLLTDGTCSICSHSQRQRLDLGTAFEKDRSVSEGKKAKRQLFQSRRSEGGPSTSSQNTVIDHELRTDTRTSDDVKLTGIHFWNVQKRDNSPSITSTVTTGTFTSSASTTSSSTVVNPTCPTISTTPTSTRSDSISVSACMSLPTLSDVDFQSPASDTASTSSTHPFSTPASSRANCQKCTSKSQKLRDAKKSIRGLRQKVAELKQTIKELQTVSINR